MARSRALLSSSMPPRTDSSASILCGGTLRSSSAAMGSGAYAFASAGQIRQIEAEPPPIQARAGRVRPSQLPYRLSDSANPGSGLGTGFGSRILGNRGARFRVETIAIFSHKWLYCEAGRKSVHGVDGEMAGGGRGGGAADVQRSPRNRRA